MTSRDRSSHAAAGITPAAITDAALAVVRAHGVDGLTMRAVAERLSVRAPSLYHHVAGRSELLRLVAQNAAALFATHQTSYEAARTVAEWIEASRRFALDGRRFYLDHPGLATVVLAGAGARRDEAEDTRASFVGAQIHSLTRLGVPADEARHVFETALRWILGAVVAEQTAPPHGDDEAMFRSGLEMMLDSMRRRLEAFASP